MDYVINYDTFSVLTNEHNFYEECKDQVSRPLFCVKIAKVESYPFISIAYNYVCYVLKHTDILFRILV